MSQQTNQNESNAQCIIEEKNGTILGKGNFNLIFHLVPLENDVLKEKLMNKFGISRFSEKSHIFNGIHYIPTISNQFSNTNNETNTKKCIEDSAKIRRERREKYRY